MDIGTGTLIVLDPVIIPNRVNNLVRAEVLHGGFGVPYQARHAHVLEHHLLPRKPVGELFVEFLTREKGRDGGEVHSGHNVANWCFWRLRVVGHHM